MGTFSNAICGMNPNKSFLNNVELMDLANKITDHYKTEHIICFGSVKENQSTHSFFIEDSGKANAHYFLLMITTETTRIEHQVQDFVNGIIQDTNISVTIIAHGLETVANALQQGSRFFTTVCRDGFYLYSSNGPNLLMGCPPLNPITTHLKAEKHYHHRYGMALGFLEAADSCFEKGYFNNTVFMLHQAVEQSCIAMIRVFMAYRSDIHKLSRLLKLCLCFSSAPQELFPTNTSEEQRLFKLLEKSYSDARYRDDYQVDGTDAKVLLAKVSGLIELTERLCIDRIKTYKIKAGPERTAPDRFSVLPESLG
jgi:HEPN domain-containing protein